MHRVAPEEFAAEFNRRNTGWPTAMDLELVAASADEVTCEWEVSSKHLQGYGIVHGGVFAGVIETLCSIGAALAALESGRSVVGLENHTSFLRAVRSGRLRAAARPVVRGRRSQLWEGEVRDEDDRVVAAGRVRLLVLEAEAQLAGEPVSVKENLDGEAGPGPEG